MFTAYADNSEVYRTFNLQRHCGNMSMIMFSLLSPGLAWQLPKNLRAAYYILSGGADQQYNGEGQAARVNDIHYIQIQCTSHRQIDFA
jgi:hypothetical protein